MVEMKSGRCRGGGAAGPGGGGWCVDPKSSISLGDNSFLRMGDGGPRRGSTRLSRGRRVSISIRGRRTHEPATRRAMTKGRMEAFSDGVIAILITIMVLELKVPE